MIWGGWIENVVPTGRTAPTALESELSKGSANAPDPSSTTINMFPALTFPAESIFSNIA
jgi:hypothetical protein